MMTDRPILFSGPMVRALLDGRKTQTRRVIKSPSVKHPCFSLLCHDDVNNVWWPYYSDDGESSVTDDGLEQPVECLFGQPGDRLWVREAWAFHPDYPESTRRAIYRANAGVEFDVDRWRPSIHMPRWASRIMLEITGVRVERLNEISGADCIAEGIVEADAPSYIFGLQEAYRDLWESINGTGSWAVNPWVWVIEFRRTKP